MTRERFYNSATQPSAPDCLVASAFTSGDATLVVDVLPTFVSGFTAGDQFRVKVGSTIYLVTALGTGNVNWAVTVAEGSADASHVVGTGVYLIDTAGAIETIRGLDAITATDRTADGWPNSNTLQSALGSRSLADLGTRAYSALTGAPPTDGAAGTGSLRTLGTGAAQAAAGNDSRLSDARTPTAHHTSHETGGSDVVSVTEAELSTSDVTTDNASTSKHGFIKKLDGNAAHYMGGDGNWSTPAGGGGGASPLTTKGDLWGFSTVDARIPIGTNGQVLTADSAQGLGLKWATPSGGGGSGIEATYDTRVDALVSLVHRWKFADASGNFADRVGSLALVKSGTVTYSLGDPHLTGAVRFGAGALGQSSGLGSIPVGGNARTFLMVYRPSASSFAKQCLLSYGTSGSTRQWWSIFINDGASDTPSLAVWADDLLVANLPCNLAAWHLFIVTYDGNQTVTLLMDGQLYGRTLGGVLNTGSSGDLHVGQTTAGANQFAGDLDDIAVLSRLMEPWEMQQLARAFENAP